MRHSERAELPRNGVPEALAVERVRDGHDMHRVIGVEVAPAQHRALKKIEPVVHAPAAASLRRARIDRCSSMHQCFLTLNQISAECSRLAVSTSAPAGNARLSPGRYASIHARVTAIRARSRASGIPM